MTGFDDFDFAEFAEPALTTVRIPGYEIGRTAGEALVDVLEGRTPPERQLVLPVELKLESRDERERTTHPSRRLR